MKDDPDGSPIESITELAHEIIESSVKNSQVLDRTRQLEPSAHSVLPENAGSSAVFRQFGNSGSALA